MSEFIETAKEIAKERLPINKYDFEIEQTVQIVKDHNYDCIALQFPEGLMCYSTALADVFEEYLLLLIFVSSLGIDVVILGESTFGACCIDDFSAKAMHAQALFHYGHSALVPTHGCGIDVYYIPVKMIIPLENAIKKINEVMVPLLEKESSNQVAMFTTAQFLDSIQVSYSI